jgi:hypothetical protein
LKALCHAAHKEWREAADGLSAAVHCCGAQNTGATLHAELAVALTRLQREAGLVFYFLLSSV